MLQKQANLVSALTSRFYFTLPHRYGLTTGIIHCISASNETTVISLSHLPSFQAEEGQGETRLGICREDWQKLYTSVTGNKRKPCTQAASPLHGSQNRNKVVATALLHFWESKKGTVPGLRGRGAPIRPTLADVPSPPPNWVPWWGGGGRESASSTPRMFTGRA